MTKIFTEFIKYKEGWVVVYKEAKFIEPIKGTRYYDGDGNIRIWGTGNCYGKNSSNIVASSIRIEGVPLVELSDKLETQAKTYATSLYSRSTEVWQVAVEAYKRAAQQNKYSEKDIQFLSNLVQSLDLMSYELNNGIISDYAKKLKKFIKSKSPQTKVPINIELEMEYKIEDFSGSMNVPIYADKATVKITNSKENTIIPINIEYEK